MLAALVRRCAATKMIGKQISAGKFTEFLEENKEKKMTTGRAWRADELRLKSDDDLHKLWYILLQEKNLLMADTQYRVQHRGGRGHQDRILKVKISQARLLTVVHERFLVRERFKAALEKEYMDTHFPKPEPKPKVLRLRTDREKMEDAKRRQAIKAIKHWRTMSNRERRSAIKQEYGRMANVAKEEFIKELRYIGQKIKEKNAASPQGDAAEQPKSEEQASQ